MIRRPLELPPSGDLPTVDLDPGTAADLARTCRVLRLEAVHRAREVAVERRPHPDLGGEPCYLVERLGTRTVAVLDDTGELAAARFRRHRRWGTDPLPIGAGAAERLAGRCEVHRAVVEERGVLVAVAQVEPGTWRLTSWRPADVAPVDLGALRDVVGRLVRRSAADGGFDAATLAELHPDGTVSLDRVVRVRRHPESLAALRPALHVLAAERRLLGTALRAELLAHGFVRAGAGAGEEDGADDDDVVVEDLDDPDRHHVDDGELDDDWPRCWGPGRFTEPEDEWQDEEPEDLHGEVRHPGGRPADRRSPAGVALGHLLRASLDDPAPLAARHDTTTVVVRRALVEASRDLPALGEHELPVGPAAREAWVDGLVRRLLDDRAAGDEAARRLVGRLAAVEAGEAAGAGHPGDRAALVRVVDLVRRQLAVEPAAADAAVRAALPALVEVAATAGRGRWGLWSPDAAAGVVAGLVVAHHRDAATVGPEQAAHGLAVDVGAADRLLAEHLGGLGPIATTDGTPVVQPLDEGFVAVVGPGAAPRATLDHVLARAEGPVVLVTTDPADVSGDHLAYLDGLHGPVEVVDTTGALGPGDLGPAALRSWDPLARTLGVEEAVDLVQRLLAVESARADDLRDGSFWFRLAENLLVPMATAASGQGQAMLALKRWLDVDEDVDVARALRGRPDAEEALRLLGGGRHSEERLHGSVLATARTALAWVAGRPVRDALGAHPQLDPARVVGGGALVVLHDPTGADASTYLTLLVEAVVAAQRGAWDRGATRRHLHVLVDRLATVRLSRLAEGLGDLPARGVTGAATFRDLRELRARCGDRIAGLWRAMARPVLHPGADPSEWTDRPVPRLLAGEVGLVLGDRTVAVADAVGGSDPWRDRALDEAALARRAVRLHR